MSDEGSETPSPPAPKDPRVCNRCGERPRAKTHRWCTACQTENRKRLQREARRAQLGAAGSMIDELMSRDLGPRIVTGAGVPAPGRIFTSTTCPKCRDLADQIRAVTERAETAEREVERLHRTLEARGPSVLMRAADLESPPGDPYAGHGPTCPCLFCAGAAARERYIESLGDA